MPAHHIHRRSPPLLGTRDRLAPHPTTTFVTRSTRAENLPGEPSPAYPELLRQPPDNTYHPQPQRLESEGGQGSSLNIPSTTFASESFVPRPPPLRRSSRAAGMPPEYHGLPYQGTGAPPSATIEAEIVVRSPTSWTRGTTSSHPDPV